jgi:hypothetical protein
VHRTAPVRLFAVPPLKLPHPKMTASTWKRSVHGNGCGHSRANSASRMEPIQVSPHEVVYLGSDFRIWIYDLIEGRSEETPVGNCYPQFWRPQSGELVCARIGPPGYEYVSLVTGQARPFPKLPERNFGLTHSPVDDITFFGEVSGFLWSETGDLYTMSLPGGRLRRVMRGVVIQYGIWYPRAPSHR